VFSTREAAERWIGEMGLTGLLTRYPLDVAVCDWAVAEDLFRPSKPAQSSREFIAGFTTAYDAQPFTWTATAEEILAKVRWVQTNVKQLVANNTK
jgi:hypothetical protein